MLVLSQLANVRLHTGDTVTTAFRVGASSGSQGPIPSDTEDTISNVQMDDVSQFANIEVPPISPVPSVASPSLDQVVVPLVLQAQLDQPVVTEPPKHTRSVCPLQPWVEPFMQDSALWLVKVGYLQGRHGPHDVEALQQDHAEDHCVQIHPGCTA